MKHPRIPMFLIIDNFGVNFVAEKADANFEKALYQVIS